MLEFKKYVKNMMKLVKYSKINIKIKLNFFTLISTDVPFLLAYDNVYWGSELGPEFSIDNRLFKSPKAIEALERIKMDVCSM